jgi:hypothetical protein
MTPATFANISYKIKPGIKVRYLTRLKNIVEIVKLIQKNFQALVFRRQKFQVIGVYWRGTEK